MRLLLTIGALAILVALPFLLLGGVWEAWWSGDEAVAWATFGAALADRPLLALAAACGLPLLLWWPLRRRLRVEEEQDF